MISKHKALIFFLLAFSMPCFAGGIKGDLIDEDTILAGIGCIVVIHLICLLAYFTSILWLRIVCGILYLPVFLVPLVLTAFNSMFALLFIPPLLFYVLTICRKRKSAP